MSTKVLAARRMVGGYTPANVQDQSVIEAAELVVQNLKEGQGPIERYTFEFPVGSGTSGNFEMKILEASQQVSLVSACILYFMLLFIYYVLCSNIIICTIHGHMHVQRQSTMRSVFHPVPRIFSNF